jgi:hypothetical protein
MDQIRPRPGETTAAVLRRSVGRVLLLNVTVDGAATSVCANVEGGGSAAWRRKDDGKRRPLDLDSPGFSLTEYTLVLSYEVVNTLANNFHTVREAMPAKAVKPDGSVAVGKLPRDGADMGHVLAELERRYDDLVAIRAALDVSLDTRLISLRRAVGHSVELMVGGDLTEYATGVLSAFSESQRVYRSIEVRRQWKDIDVLLVVNGDTAIIIEDKTDTKDHSGQLDRYRKAVTGEFQGNWIAAVYLKTGDQGNYRSVESAGYGCFLRRDFLAVLDRGQRAGVRNDIFADFHGRLRRIEEAVQSYRSVTLAGWHQDSNRWAGFFLALQQRLGEGDWKNVPNQRGGFMGFWWHWRGDKYLQLEWTKLCFKINVIDEAQQAAKWLEWNHALMRLNGTSGVKVKMSRRKAGDCMTVALLAGDYRQADADGRLDFEKTVQVLRDAESFMDAAGLSHSATAAMS